jgi:hypothetical protein
MLGSNLWVTFKKLNFCQRNHFNARTILSQEGGASQKMHTKTLASVGILLVGMTVIAAAEPQRTPPPAPVNVQINTEFLNDLMRSAMMFNAMVQNLNLNKTLHESGVSPDSTDPNGRPMKRAAAVLGAGAGVGVAVGGMTGGQKGAVIGAIAGSAGASVLDQIVQHQAAKARLANADNYRDNHPDNDREPQHFKERVPQP